MRQIFRVASAFVGALLLAVAPAAAEPRLDILRQYHDMYCPTDEPCNYCRFPMRGPYKFVDSCGGPTNEPWGTDCRCKSRDGWQAGKVMTIYPDKPFSVNFDK